MDHAVSVAILYGILISLLAVLVRWEFRRASRRRRVTPRVDDAWLDVR